MRKNPFQLKFVTKGDQQGPAVILPDNEKELTGKI